MGTHRRARYSTPRTGHRSGHDDGMRPLTLAAAALLLPACTSGGSPRSAPTTTGSPAPSTSATADEREVRRLAATLDTAPPGVRVTPDGPTCLLVERTGGPYGKPRYSVRVDLRGLVVPDGTVKTYYDVTLDAGGRTYDGYLALSPPHQRGDSNLWTLAPAPSYAPETFAVSPENNIGIQEIPPDLTTCHLTLNPPSTQENLSGGRILGDATGSPVAVDPDGVPRPYSQR
jgi:hypothetical protein